MVASSASDEGALTVKAGIKGRRRKRRGRHPVRLVHLHMIIQLLSLLRENRVFKNGLLLLLRLARESISLILGGITIIWLLVQFTERKRQSRQQELLMNHYVRMLCRNHVELKISKVWEAIMEGLKIYPFNPPLHNALVEINNLYTSPNKRRWTFDDYFHKKPSVITWLYLLSFETSAGGSKHRICGLFERALEDSKLQILVILWRCYLEYEMNIACNFAAAKTVFFRANHACPWSKRLWLDGFLKLDSALTVKELSDL